MMVGAKRMSQRERIVHIIREYCMVGEFRRGFEDAKVEIWDTKEIPRWL